LHTLNGSAFGLAPDRCRQSWKTISQRRYTYSQNTNTLYRIRIHSIGKERRIFQP